MDLSATDSSAMAWRSTQQRRIAAESTEEREARLHQLSVTQRQRIAAESTEEREARLQQLRILPNRNNHQDLLINCHSKYIPILLVLIDVFHYAIIEAFVMLLGERERAHLVVQLRLFFYIYIYIYIYIRSTVLAPGWPCATRKRSRPDHTCKYTIRIYTCIHMYTYV